MENFFVTQREENPRILLGSVASLPTTVVPNFRAGLDYGSAVTKFRLVANLRTLLVEHYLTSLVRPNVQVGYNLVLDSRTQNIEKYDFGLTWEPTSGAFVGVRHESNSKGTLQLGKILFNFHHIASQA